MSSHLVCKVCQQEPETGRLNICQYCAARLCEQHVYRRGGKVFCDRQCADENFFGEPEDDDPQDRETED